MKYRPDRILVDARVKDEDSVKTILKRFAGVEVEVLDSGHVNPQALFPSGFNEGKKILYLKALTAEPVKLCPGFSEQVLCCNYYVINLIENCPLECTYCILQAYLNKPVLVFHVNLKEIMDSVRKLAKENPKRNFRIGTGEHSDSLALDSIFQVNPYLVESFAKLDNVYLELKTKTDEIEPLLGLKHNGKTVVAWSLNPPHIIKRQEIKTASLDKRLAAAQRLAAEGYKIAFHFDPIVHYPGWENDYHKTVEQMFESVDQNCIAWISLGTFRYLPQLKQVAEARFPKTEIYAGEFVLAEDGKMRYLKSIRTQLLKSVSEKISEMAPEVPLYLCMEKHALWDKTMAHHPKDSKELERFLCKNLR